MHPLNWRKQAIALKIPARDAFYEMLQQSRLAVWGAPGYDDRGIAEINFLKSLRAFHPLAIEAANIPIANTISTISPRLGWVCPNKNPERNEPTAQVRAYTITL